MGDSPRPVGASIEETQQREYLDPATGEWRRARFERSPLGAPAPGDFESIYGTPPGQPVGEEFGLVRAREEPREVVPPHPLLATPSDTETRYRKWLRAACVGPVVGPSPALVCELCGQVFEPRDHKSPGPQRRRGGPYLSSEFVWSCPDDAGALRILRYMSAGEG